ncbi:MAG TPA: thiamine-phosphate kinase [Candidatus Acidoferrales bacterium]|nr:thiamine-phosphate kinase [Candidatus Acidoferrales bacterium]
MGQEDQLIERIRRAIPSRNRGTLRLGIGDDAALISPRKGFEWVLSCDAFLESVHFLVNSHPADSIGFKALARATSDLAAMGAHPRIFLLTLALPNARTGKWLDEFLGGMGRAARKLGITIAGGDLTSSSKISISVTVLGEVSRGLAIKRFGARPGDILFVSGRLGGAKLGLELIKSGALTTASSKQKTYRKLLRPHLYPQIRVGLGAWLAARRIASAMIDISDGLSTDLARLCAASGVGARIWAERVPCVKVPSRSASKLLPALKLDPLQMALHGGDDYELLFSVPHRNVQRLRRAPGFSEIASIGEIERGGQIKLVDKDGRSKRLRPGGWDPFERKA